MPTFQRKRACFSMHSNFVLHGNLILFFRSLYNQFKPSLKFRRIVYSDPLFIKFRNFFRPPCLLGLPVFCHLGVLLGPEKSAFQITGESYNTTIKSNITPSNPSFIITATQPQYLNFSAVPPSQNFKFNNWRGWSLDFLKKKSTGATHSRPGSSYQ